VHIADEIALPTPTVHVDKRMDLQIVDEERGFEFSREI
jgi:hypothetical protein